MTTELLNRQILDQIKRFYEMLHNHYHTVRFRVVASLMLAALIATTVTACPPFDPPPPPSPPSTAANVEFDTALPGTAPPCQALNTNYLYEPIALKPSDGSDASQKHPGSTEWGKGPINGVCTYVDTQSNLKQGKWRLMNAAVGQCEVDLHEGLNKVTLSAINSNGAVVCSSQ